VIICREPSNTEYQRSRQGILRRAGRQRALSPEPPLALKPPPRPCPLIFSDTHVTFAVLPLSLALLAAMFARLVRRQRLSDIATTASASSAALTSRQRKGVLITNADNASLFEVCAVSLAGRSSTRRIRQEISENERYTTVQCRREYQQGSLFSVARNAFRPPSSTPCRCPTRSPVMVVPVCLTPSAMPEERVRSTRPLRRMTIQSSRWRYYAATRPPGSRICWRLCRHEGDGARVVLKTPKLTPTTTGWRSSTPARNHAEYQPSVARYTPFSEM